MRRLVPFTIDFYFRAAETLAPSVRGVPGTRVVLARHMRSFSASPRRRALIVLWYQCEFDVVNTDLSGYRPASAVTPFWNTWEWSI